jgi:hypothetical protein
MTQTQPFHHSFHLRSYRKVEANSSEEVTKTFRTGMCFEANKKVVNTAHPIQYYYYYLLWGDWRVGGGWRPIQRSQESMVFLFHSIVTILFRECYVQNAFLHILNISKF